MEGEIYDLVKWNRGTVRRCPREYCEKLCFINPKLITREGTFRTDFHGADIPFSRNARANAVLKIGNVYRQGGKYYPQIFLKECKITKYNFPAESF